MSAADAFAPITMKANAVMIEVPFIFMLMIDVWFFLNANLKFLILCGVWLGENVVLKHDNIAEMACSNDF